MFRMEFVLEYDFQSSVGHALCMTAHRFERAMNDELVPQGITFRQCQVLAWTAFAGEMSQAEMAERMNIEPASLVPVLDRMERDGLIERVTVPEDRRRKNVRVLKKAELLWKKIVASAERVKARATQGLSPDERATLIQLLARVERNLAVTEPFEGTASESIAGREPSPAL